MYVDLLGRKMLVVKQEQKASSKKQILQHDQSQFQEKQLRAVRRIREEGSIIIQFDQLVT